MASRRTDDPAATPESPQALAANTLVLLAAAMGVLLVGVGLVQMSGASDLLATSSFGLQRTLVGVLLLLAAGLGQALHRARRPRAASVAMLVVALLALGANAYTSGLGVHTVALPVAALLVMLAGGLAGNRAAFGLCLLYLAMVGLLAALEASGQLPGAQVAARARLMDRVLVHGLIAMAALLAAWLLNRILGAALQQALREGERLALLVKAANNWDWEADTQLFVTRLSDNFDALTGHSREEFLQLGRPDGPQPVKDEDFHSLMQDIRARKPYHDRINCFRARDGRLLWMLSSGEPVFDAVGKHVGWRGVSHNITSERQAQQQHRRTADMLDRLISASPDAICVARLDSGRLLFTNAGFRQLVGRPEAELIGRSGLELGLWRDEAEALRLRAAVMASGMVRDHRSALHLADGRWRDVLLSAASFDWDGRPVAVFITRDITEMERGRIEAEAILDHANVGIALKRGGRFERVNPHWREIFGSQALQLADTGQPLPCDQDIADTALAFEREFIRPDGQRITVQLHARGLPETLASHIAHGVTDAARDSATLWIAEDVSARRRQERELEAARRDAEAASHAKSAFLATMSHEIRTPLNGVLGLARLLQQAEPGDARQPQYLAHLVGAAESLNEIVSNVLDLSKIEAGHLQLEKVEFDLHALARASFEGCAALGRERGLDMRLQLAPDLPRLVIGDPLRVRQIMANFLVNALKFTERGHIHLVIEPRAPGHVRLAVQDSGIGVSPAMQDRLFRPFAQADDSTTRRFGGTGLGLSICRELAVRMAGGVGVDSDGVSGSTFWAELALPTALTIDDTATRRRIPLPPRYPLAGLRLLVAEDNPVNRLIITALLQRLGAEVVEAEDGEQAVQIAKAQAQRLDAVLMDLHMPKVDGLRATRLLREDPTTAALPIHAFTAAVLDQERQAALDAGMNGFITKPVAEPELVRVLGRHGHRA
jgi:PAS domain S-box-containing protein